MFDTSFTSTLRSVVSNVTKADSKENAQILSDFRVSQSVSVGRSVGRIAEQTADGRPPERPPGCGREVLSR